jgi:hypothetical protein
MKRNWKIYCFLALKKLGLLCKVPPPQKLKVRVQSTVHPPEHISTLDVQILHYLQSKKNSYSKCKFDVEKRTCECGVTLEKFGEKGCNNKNNKQVILG